jgi:hypothetical protein
MSNQNEHDLMTDDLVDYRDSSDDTDITDEWTDDDLDSDLEDDQPVEEKPKKKKNSLLTIIIIAVMILGAGGVGLMMMGGDSSAPIVENSPIADLQTAPIIEESPVVVQTPPQEGVPVDNSAVVQIQQPVQDGGLMANPEVLSQPAPMAEVTTPQAAPSDTQPVSSEVVNSVTVPADAPVAALAPVVTQDPAQQAVAQPNVTVAEAIIPDVTPVSDFPSVDAIKKSDAIETSPSTETLNPVVQPNPVDVMAVPQGQDQNQVTLTDSPAPVQAETALSPQPLGSPSDSSAEMAKIQAQLETAMSKIADLESSLRTKDEELKVQLQNIQIKEDSVSQESSDMVKELNDKIADLEAQLAQKSSSKDEVQEFSEPIILEVKTEKVAVSNAVNKPQLKVVPVKYKPDWSLKSAKTGSAIIEDKRTGDYKTVRIGDNVSGLGSIKSISKTPSGWVIEASSQNLTE